MNKEIPKICRMHLQDGFRDLSEQQIEEMLDMETQLTVFQMSFMAKAMTDPALSMPLWGDPKTQAWMEATDLPLHLLPVVMDNMQMRELLQISDLEKMGLMRQVSQQKKEYWQLTARGRLAVIWHVSHMADYSQILRLP
ncbi:MAG: hypothetical protein BVN35_09420 [Proteobacteria bacterium ST_bin11]|nr:MAG: hypothetical protein BVN35_09420 [Proteobacteria bacterium ST_bin11]